MGKCWLVEPPLSEDGLGRCQQSPERSWCSFLCYDVIYSYFSCVSRPLIFCFPCWAFIQGPPTLQSQAPFFLPVVPLEGIFSRIINRHPDAAHCSAGSGPRFPHPTPPAMLFRPLHPAGLIRHRHPPDCAPSLLKAQLVHYRVQKADPRFCNSPLLFTSLPQYCINIHI